METLNCKTIINIFNAKALEGRKIPHGVSNPVFRFSADGSLLAAAFIFTYNADQLKAKSIARPGKWIAIDLKTQAVTEYSCNDVDFTTVPVESMCSLNAETDEKFSAEYSKQTLAIFDLILKKYLLTSVFDKQLNDVYMYMMLKPVSTGFKALYRDLNLVDRKDIR